MMTDRGVSRRGVLTAGGGIGVMLASGAPVAHRTPGRPEPTADKDVIVAEATNVALTVSPDGKTIAFDPLGILWTIPVRRRPRPPPDRRLRRHRAARLVTRRHRVDPAYEWRI